MEFPIEPEVGVGAIIISDNKILLVKRVNPPGKGRWSVPGGHLKLGESIYEAAKRELKEETGIIAEPLGIINVDEYVEYLDDITRYHYVLIDVLMKPKTPIESAKAGSDAEKIGLYPLKDALKLNLTKSTRSLIEKLIKMEGKYPLIESKFIIEK